MSRMRGPARKAQSARLPWALLVLFLAPLASPMAAGQAVDHEVHLDRVRPVDLADVVEDSGGSCEAGHLEIDPERQRLRFSEGPTETACAEARYDVPLPPGARDVVLRFNAQREVQQGIGGVDVPLRMPQEVRVYSQAGVLLHRVDVFDPAADSRGPVEFTTPEMFVPLAAASVTVAWYFEDRGYTGGQPLPNPGTAQSFSAEVASPVVVVPGLPVATTVERGEREQEAGRVLERVVLAARLEGLEQEDIVRVRVPSDLELERVVAPDGSGIEPEVVASTQDRGGLHLEVHGLVGDDGTYRFVFLRSQVVPPVEYPVLHAAALLLPLVAAVPAVVGASAYRMQAGDTASRRFLTSVVVAVLLYVLVVLLDLVLDPGLGTIPLRPAALAGHALLLALLAGFLTLWAVGASFQRRQARISEARARAEVLERSNEELDRFAFVASHDLQEPLRKIEAYTQLLREDPELAQEARRMVQASGEAAARMRAMVRDMLHYARQGQEVTDARPVDLGAVWDRARHDLGQRVDEEGAQVTQDALPTVQGDPMRLQQLFQNLLSNPLKYRHPERPPQVHATAERTDEGWHIEVQDNGRGIPEAQRQQAFRLFERLDGGKEGTGLGLAICQRIVEAHGGRIWIGDGPGGEGTTFHLLLPPPGARGASAVSARAKRS